MNKVVPYLYLHTRKAPPLQIRDRLAAQKKPRSKRYNAPALMSLSRIPESLEVPSRSSILCTRELRSPKQSITFAAKLDAPPPKPLNNPEHFAPRLMTVLSAMITSLKAPSPWPFLHPPPMEDNAPRKADFMNADAFCEKRP